MKLQHIPGLSLAVIKNGKLLRTAGYGLANVELNVPVTPQTIFQSGSIGKMFTAALVLLLLDDGRIVLDSPIHRYLPDTPRTWRKITIRQLLTHTSGLADPYSKINFRKDYTDKELLKLEGTIPLLFEPGTKWSYSNMGYHVLGFICNWISRRFYGDQLKERIFGPAGMATTRVISECDIVPYRADGYEYLWADGLKTKNGSRRV